MPVHLLNIERLDQSCNSHKATAQNKTGSSCSRVHGHELPQYKEFQALIHLHLDCQIL